MTSNIPGIYPTKLPLQLAELNFHNPTCTTKLANFAQLHPFPRILSFTLQFANLSSPHFSTFVFSSIGSWNHHCSHLPVSSLPWIPSLLVSIKSSKPLLSSPSLSHSPSTMSLCSTNGADTRVAAIILDLDGTLLNTEKATKDILREFLGRYGKVVDWEKENKRLGMIHTESSIIRDYDLPLTPEQFSREILPLHQLKWPLAKPLPGANRLIKHLHKHGVPFALASNTETKNVEKKISNQHGRKESFLAVIGSDQVNSGKPAPDVFLEAARRIGIDAARCLVIEDSVVGVMAAKAAGMKVVAVPSLQAHADRYSIADYVLHSLLEFRPELLGLPAFDDWVGNALPIDPMYVKGQVRKGLMCDVPDDGPNALPDQVSGVYFGWAKLNTLGVFKVVVGIEWKHHSSSAERVIKPYLIGACDQYTSGQKMQIVLVGYIRELIHEESESEFKIDEEDKSIASEALDLLIFAHNMNDPLLDEITLEEGGEAPGK